MSDSAPKRRCTICYMPLSHYNKTDTCFCHDHIEDIRDLFHRGSHVLPAGLYGDKGIHLSTIQEHGPHFGPDDDLYLREG